MDLSPEELRDLAAFFAKRLTPDLQPVDPLEPPPPGDPTASWLERLQQARSQDALHVLARRIARTDPGDANLQEACQLLEPRSTDSAILGAVIAGGAATALGAMALTGAFLGWAGWMGALSAGPVQPEVVITSRITAEPPSTPYQEAAAAAAEVAPAAPPIAEAQAPAERTVLPGEPADPPGEAASGRCAGEPGAVVGYWYAGRRSPGEAGDVVTLSHAVNVRVDYPGRHNDFDTRSAITCVLEPGDRVRLSREPVHVPGDAWWVPLVSGDLLAAAPDGRVARR